jgi:hypothetical protein
MAGHVFFSIGLKIVAYDHHLIAESRYAFQVPFAAANASFIMSVVMVQGRGIDSLDFGVSYSRLMNRFFELFHYFWHQFTMLSLLGPLIPSARTKALSIAWWPWRRSPQNDSWLGRWR